MWGVQIMKSYGSHRFRGRRRSQVKTISWREYVIAILIAITLFVICYIVSFAQHPSHPRGVRLPTISD
jgi:hypothetical protein